MLGVSGLSAQAVRAQNILVAVPDTSVLTTQARIPLWIDDISAHDVQGFLFTITYDSTHFAIDDVDINGHLAQHFSMAVNRDEPARIIVAGAKASPITGRGVLLNLNLVFKRNGESAINLEQFAFNEGAPFVSLQQGGISNRNAPLVTDDPENPQESFTVLGHYPNPLRTKATLIYSIDQPAEISLQVLDVTGREVLRHPALLRPAGAEQRLLIDASGLSAGVYLYRLTAQGANFFANQTGMLTVVR